MIPAQTRIPEGTAATKAVAAGTPELAHGLRVAAIYQDCLAERWVRRLCDRVTELAGADAVRIAAWSASQLSDAQFLSEAVLAAIDADVIVVSACAAEALPLSVYIWIDSWLPRRCQREGALIALMGVSEQSSAASEEAQEYLRAVARLGRLDFLLRDQRVPNDSAGPSQEEKVPESTLH